MVTNSKVELCEYRKMKLKLPDGHSQRNFQATQRFVVQKKDVCKKGRLLQ